MGGSPATPRAHPLITVVIDDADADGHRAVIVLADTTDVPAAAPLLIVVILHCQPPMMSTARERIRYCTNRACNVLGGATERRIKRGLVDRPRTAGVTARLPVALADDQWWCDGLREYR